ncbi:unnamed protein product [marine sediment metagenome]|uniref:Uncharacterized protein n=1 Tax=marine sediment metagenome TaxID=412755 RepID=X1FN27_9ZZZZ
MTEQSPGQPLSDTPSPKIETEGVKTLLGDPKKAIIKLALPMIAAMSVHTIYNLVDAIPHRLFKVTSCPGGPGSPK